MNSKTMHVAMREYVENLRTKTFWIGIFSLPVVFALFIVVGRIFERSKDVRTYAILDESPAQWLSQGIERRAESGDLESAMRQFVGEIVGAEDADRSEGALAQRAREAAERLGDNEVRRELFQRIAALLPETMALAKAEGRAPSAADFSKLGSAGELLDWFRGLKPEQLSLLQGQLDRTRYRRLDLADLGIGADSSIETQRDALNRAIDAEKLFAYFEVPKDPLGSNRGRYVSNNLSDSSLRDWFAGHATELVRGKRFEVLEAKLDAAERTEARKILSTFAFEKERVAEGGKSTTKVAKAEEASSFAPVAFVYLLWIAVFTAAQMLLTNTVEEKSNRLIEVLLSSVSPLQLMSGKVLGIAFTGLTIVVFWALTAIVGTQLVPQTSKLAEWGLREIVANPIYLGSFIAYFLAGYLLYAAVLVAMGSVCDSLKEAQNLLQPVFILLIVPLIAMLPVVQDPNGTLARVLTYIPLFTPFLMMNRAGGPPPTWEYLATTGLILVSLFIAFRGAGKVFRVGILMTGKPPRIGEILRWLRAPAGSVQPIARSDNKG
ncbi:MAG: ABC transporter permease [Planctomycetota bacterium]